MEYIDGANEDMMDQLIQLDQLFQNENFEKNKQTDGQQPEVDSDKESNDE